MANGMNRLLAAGLLIFSATLGLASAAEAPPKADDLDEVLIIGEQPGPGLWKVSKGDHVMWVLAAHSPVPKGMTWRSQKVEARIAESQEVLYSGGVDIDAGIGLLKGITLIPAALKASKIPDSKTLKDVLDPATYSKWSALRRKYAVKDDDVEKLRPSIALSSLRNSAFRKSGLGGVSVYEVVSKIREKHKVPRVTTPKVKRTLNVEDPRGILKSAQKLELPDLPCFKQGLDKVDSELERAKTLANAWSRGDIEKLRGAYRNVPLKDTLKEVCGYSLMAAINEGGSKDAEHAKKMMDDLLWHAEQATYQSQLDWIAAARKALDKNRTTFAVLNLAEVLSPDGHLAKLKELGYTIDEPL